MVGVVVACLFFFHKVAIISLKGVHRFHFSTLHMYDRLSLSPFSESATPCSCLSQACLSFSFQGYELDDVAGEDLSCYIFGDHFCDRDKCTMISGN